MEAIIEAMSDVFGLVGSIVSSMAAEPILLFLLAASLVPIGISIFKRLKRSAKA